MLNSLRSAANNVFFRIILILIVLAFALWGIGDIIRGRNDFDLVKFKKLPNITLSHFYQAKKETINQIQHNSKEKITAEMLDEMNINRQILSNLIQKKMFEAWIESQNIAISEKIVAEHIKEIPQFQDANKKFNIELFKKFLSTLPISEEEFYESFKFDIARHLLEEEVKKTIHTPKMFEDIVVDFLAQVKTAKYIKINLEEKNNLPDIKPVNEELEKFYQENKELFKLPEERTIKYILLDKNTLTNFKGTEEEKAAKLMDNLKSLEDAVAAGENINEIAAEHKAQIKSISGSFENIMKADILSNFADSIFAMNQHELSYPTELPNDKGYVLFEVEAVKEGRVPDYEIVKTEVAKAYIKKAYVTANIEKLKEFEARVLQEDFESLCTNYGYSTSNIEVLRGSREHNIPEEVAYTILNTQFGAVSPLVILENNAYIIKVVKTSEDTKQADIIRSSNLQNISNYFKASFTDEIIAYFYNKNTPNIRTELLGERN